MSRQQDAVSDDLLAPVDFFVVEFPNGELTSPGFDALLELARSGVIAILDVEFVAVDPDGTARRVPIAELTVPANVDLSAWEGASTEMIDDEDLQILASTLTPGSIAVIAVYENRWLFGVIDRWRSAGAVLVMDGGLHADEVTAALEAADAV
ncbi:MAG: hypothetical protein EA388_06440 [Nitriliruptor sp.]|nr:MAG: hypothetical protein EA388_06440 [Nitriliruptor sp.]